MRKLIIFIMILTGIYLQAQESEIQISKKVYPNIGKLHNEIIKDFFDSKSLNFILKHKYSYLQKYFKEKYNYDAKYTIKLMTQYINEKEGCNCIKLIQEQLQGKASKRYISITTEVLKEVANDKYDLYNKMKVIEKYIEKVKKDTHINSKEKNVLINSLIVFKDSLKFWHDFLPGLQNSTEAARIKEEDYWKIAAADYVEGITGGLLGGPLGAFLGIVSGSLVMVISLL